jgi:hypothetical protein
MEPVFTYSGAFVYDATPKIFTFVEIEGRTARSVFGTESLFRSGFAYHVRRNVEIGLAGAVGLTNDSPHWEMKAGFYWTWERKKKVFHPGD